VKRLEALQLKRDLQKAATEVQPGAMEVLIQKAYAAQIDPHNYLLSHLERIAEQSEVTQCILRARAASERRDEPAFRHAVAALSKYEAKRFSIRDSRMMTAVILQHAAQKVLRLAFHGESISGYMVLDHALSCCRGFLVETEPMQVCRMLVALAKQTGGSHAQAHKLMGADLAAYIEQSKLQQYNTAQYTLDRYPSLNPPDAKNKSAMFSFRGGGSKEQDLSKQAVAAALLHFSPVIITRPLLNNHTARDAKATEVLFGGLQAVMGDLKLKKFKPKDTTFLQKRAGTFIYMPACVSVSLFPSLSLALTTPLPNYCNYYYYYYYSPQTWLGWLQIYVKWAVKTTSFATSCTCSSASKCQATPTC
jgi:hypothetical protein